MEMTPGPGPGDAGVPTSLLFLARDLDALDEALRAAARPLAEPGASVLGAWVGPGAPRMEDAFGEGLSSGGLSFTLVQSFARWGCWAVVRLDCAPRAGERECREAIFEALRASGEGVFHPVFCGGRDLPRVVEDLERLGGARGGSLGPALPAPQEAPGTVVLRRLQDAVIGN